MTTNVVTGAVGITAGIIELIIAFLALKASKNELLRNLKYFAYGAALLGLAQLIFMGILPLSGFKDVAFALALRAPLRAIGVGLMLYSIILLLNERMAKTVGTIIGVLMIIFIVGVVYSLVTTRGYDPLWPSLHLIYLTLLPWYVASVTYKVYKESHDETALYVSVALLIFGLSVVSVILLHMVGAGLAVTATVGTALEIIGMVMILYAFIKA